MMTAVEKIVSEGLAWGVYDLQDKSWLGNEQGPIRHVGMLRDMSAELRARAAATLANEMFCAGSRYRARPIPPDVNVKKPGGFKPRHTAEQALERLEKGPGKEQGDETTG